MRAHIQPHIAQIQHSSVKQNEKVKKESKS